MKTCICIGPPAKDCPVHGDKPEPGVPWYNTEWKGKYFTIPVFQPAPKKVGIGFPSARSVRVDPGSTKVDSKTDIILFCHHCLTINPTCSHPYRVLTWTLPTPLEPS